jgi:hypothetical protein
MFSNRIDLGLTLAIIELLARVGSIASITLLLMLFVGEGFQPSTISANEWGWSSFLSDRGGNRYGYRVVEGRIGITGYGEQPYRFLPGVGIPDA